MQYIFAESLKDLENKYKTQQKVEIFAELDSEVEDVIFKNKHLFEDEEIDFWISLDPYNDTLIEIEDIKYLLKFAKTLAFFGFCASTIFTTPLINLPALFLYFK